MDVLTTHGSVSASDLERVISLMRGQGGCLANLLLREGILDEEQLFFLLRRRLELPIIADSRLRRLKLPPEAARRLPRALAREVQALPVAYEPGKGLLTVAMLDPTDAEAVARIRQSANVPSVKPLLARRSPLAAMINQLYGDAGEVEVKSAPNHPAVPAAAPQRRRPRETAPQPNQGSREATVQIDPAMEQDIKAMGEVTGMVDAKTTVMKPQHMPGPTSPARADDQTTPPVKGARAGEPRRQVVARSLLKDGAADPPATMEGSGNFPPVPVAIDPDEPTPVRAIPVPPRQRPAPPMPPASETQELDLDAIEVDDEDDLIEPDDLLPLTPMADGPTPSLTPLPDVEQMEQIDALMSGLLGSVGALANMLEERLIPGGTSCREHGQVARAVGLELGLGELQLDRVVLAARLCGLDRLLRREAGLDPLLDPARIFDLSGRPPGGIGGQLRTLGAGALGLGDGQGAPDPLPTQLLRMVLSFLALREESGLGAVDPDVASRTMRAEGHDPALVEALVKAMEVTARTLVR